MKMKSFSKTLRANDVGITGSHQSGLHIPKIELELLTILPSLDLSVKNPDAWIECLDVNRQIHQFIFVYYNNKFHDPTGTRNEFRITHMTGYLKKEAACEGDTFQISKNEDSPYYEIRVLRQEKNRDIQKDEDVVRIKIKSDWRRVH